MDAAESMQHMLDVVMHDYTVTSQDWLKITKNVTNASLNPRRTTYKQGHALSFTACAAPATVSNKLYRPDKTLSGLTQNTAQFANSTRYTSKPTKHLTKRPITKLFTYKGRITAPVAEYLRTPLAYTRPLQSKSTA